MRLENGMKTRYGLWRYGFEHSDDGWGGFQCPEIVGHSRTVCSWDSLEDVLKVKFEQADRLISVDGVFAKAYEVRIYNEG